MKKGMILVTGGAGFIGSHVNLMLHDAGFDTVIYDNLSTGNPKAVTQGTLVVGDLGNRELLREVFAKYRPIAVMHFAALTDVGESVRDPSLYYTNNVINTLNLLNTMLEFEVKTLIFSSSAAVYGIPKGPSVLETAHCQPINPYGETKLMVERILKDYYDAYGLNSCSLRYFNAAGGDPMGTLKHYKEKENNLIPILLASLKKEALVTVYGTDYETKDGTCIRDYIHVADLGQAHILALQNLLNGNVSPCYNLGNGKGFTVKEVIKAVQEVTGQKVIVVEGERRAGDPPILLANSEKAFRELGWSPSYPDLKTIIEHAWKARQ